MTNECRAPVRIPGGRTALCQQNEGHSGEHAVQGHWRVVFDPAVEDRELLANWQAGPGARPGLPDPPCYECGHPKAQHGEDEQAGPDCMGVGFDGDCPCEGYRPGSSPATSVAPVPNTPGTPRRSIRVPDELWNAALATAGERGENLSDVLRKALERYVRSKR